MNVTIDAVVRVRIKLSEIERFEWPDYSNRPFDVDRVYAKFYTDEGVRPQISLFGWADRGPLAGGPIRTYTHDVQVDSLPPGIQVVMAQAVLRAADPKFKAEE